MRILHAFALVVTGLAQLPLAAPGLADDRSVPSNPPVNQVGGGSRQDLFGPWQVCTTLNGQNESQAEAGNRAATAPAGSAPAPDQPPAGRWADVQAPFLLSHVPGIDGRATDQVHYAWARRDFIAPTDTQFRNAVLHLHGVRWGSKIWLNGKEIGGHLGAYGAFEFDITDTLAWGKPNQLLLRLTGWAEVPMSQFDDPRHVGKTPLVPHGAAMFRWGNRQSGIIGGLWIDYFDYARMEQVQVLADPASGKVRVRGGMKNYTRQFGQRWIEPVVLRDGKEVARGERVEIPTPNTSFGRVVYDFDFEVAVKGPAAWSPAQPNLYRLQLDLVQEGRRLQRWGENFGFRSFQATTGKDYGVPKPPGFYLNGQRFFLRGICTWGQNSGWRAERTTDPKAVQHFMVDLQRAANLNCVRNHTIMLDGVWLDVADRTGYLLLQEFPITMNYRNPAYTDEEKALYHQRCLDEFRSLLPLYWNHPSVAMWVPTNESGFDTEWENEQLYQMFKQADPSRPVMRTSEQSPDIYDTHCYSGFWSGSEGQFEMFARSAVPKARAARKPLTNTEYIENFGGPRVTKWMGPKPANVSDEQWEQQRQEVYAQFILEQTEALRRLGYDGTLPYA